MPWSRDQVPPTVGKKSATLANNGDIAANSDPLDNHHTKVDVSRRPSLAMDDYLKRTPSPLHPTWMKNLTQHGNHTGATSNRCSASEMSEGITT